MDTKTSTRFWAKVDSGAPNYEPDRCWFWTAGSFRSGYGAFTIKGKLRKAHRVMWEHVHGPIPDGMFVCHRCDNPPCVNPTHLFLGTPMDNMRDKVAKGRLVASPGERNGMWGKRKSHCKQGHPLTGDNVYLHGGDRHCAACRRKRIAAWNAARSAERRARRAQSAQIAS